MFLKRISNFLQNLWEKLKKIKKTHQKNTLLDTIKLNLFGLKIEISRELPVNYPHELTVVVPRAELRKNIAVDKFKKADLEVLLNSITIAHSPRYEPIKFKPSETTDLVHRKLN